MKRDDEIFLPVVQLLFRRTTFNDAVTEIFPSVFANRLANKHTLATHMFVESLFQWLNSLPDIFFAVDHIPDKINDAKGFHKSSRLSV